MVRYSAIGLLLVACVAGCSPGPPPSGARESNGGGDAPGQDYVSPTIPFGIGDVEAGMFIKARLDIRSRTRSIVYEEVLTARKDLAKVSITVSRPWPEELWLTFTTGKGGATFEGNVVVVKGEIFVEDRSVQNFEFAFQEEVRRFEHVERFNVMAHLDAIPETLLVRARAEATLLKDLEAIPEDLSALELSPDQTVPIRSNPVRIDFKAEDSQ